MPAAPLVTPSHTHPAYQNAHPAGALAGALHGCAWIPQRWWDAMGEVEGERGVRDEAMAAALALPLNCGGGSSGGQQA